MLSAASAAPLLVEQLGVGHAGVGEARQAVVASHVGADLLGEQRVRRDVGVGHGAHVHRTGADAVDERRAPVDVLVEHQAAQGLGVADEHRAGDAPGSGRAHVGRRRVDERDEQLRAADDLGERVRVVHERRRGHGVDGRSSPSRRRAPPSPACARARSRRAAPRAGACGCRGAWRRLGRGRRSSCGASSGRPMHMTKSICGSCSQSAAMPSTSARRTRRRSPVSGSRTYSTSEPVP